MALKPTDIPTINPADIATVSRLLDEVLALLPHERESWLAALTPDHQRHAAVLRDMLARHERLDIDRPLEAMPQLSSDEAVARTGELIGPYRLLHEIGRGGMGSVWLAERADGSFKRQVALKLPRLAWGAGLAERMARERDIGALLEHPAIARLYDAGVDERGRPYLALEYIAGQQIDAWCEAQALSVRDRLRLFVQVARAVAYAHGRLVVHRDLKPSNVLVTPDGQAHLLDFGIAKLLHESGVAETGLTQQQGRVMTPNYASPEQVAGEPITVQSDVYSLGVLLYELLTGTLPFAPKRGTLGAVEDAILQGDAPPASSRVKDRATAKALRGEVDAILAKAMQREPGRRYATADALAQDVERHLSGETVSARPDSVAYRMRKALRRHWFGAAALSAVVLAVLVGSGVAVVQSRRALEAAERARVVKDFVTEVFRANVGADGDAMQLRQLPAEQLLAHGARLIESRFPGQPAMRAELLGVVGGIYAQMGAFRLAAEFTKRQLDVLDGLRPERAERLRVILRLSEALLNDRATAAATKYAGDALRVAEGDDLGTYDALVMLLRCQARTGQLEPARMTLRKVQQLEQRVDVSMRISQAWAQAAQASMLSDDNRAEAAFAAYDQAIAQALRVEGAGSLVAADIRLEAADHLMSLNRWDQARAHYEPALAVLKASGQAGEARALFESTELEFMFTQYGRQSAVEGAQRIGQLLGALRQRSAMVPAEMLGGVERRLTWAELWGGNIENAQARLDRSASIALDPANRGALRGRVALASLVAKIRGRHDEAEALGRQALALRLETGAGGAQFTVVDHIAHVDNLLMQGRYDDADAYMDAMPSIAPVAGDPVVGDYYTDAMLELRARSRLERGDAAGALLILGDKAGRVNDGDDGALPPPLNLNVSRGLLWCQLGQQARGLALLDKAAALRVAYAFAHDPGLAWQRAQTGLCALQAGRRAEASRLAGLSREAFMRQPDVSPYYKAPLFKLERALGLHLPPV